MKNMNVLKLTNGIVLVCTGIFFCTCNPCRNVDAHTVKEDLQIMIQNNTDSLIYISLFPPQDKLDGGIFYRFSDIGSGFHLTEFDLPPNSDDILFYSGTLDAKPYTLMSQLFDSIHISFPDRSNTIIRFTHETVTGYSENLFSPNSSWNFRIENDEMPTDCGPNPRKSYCYRFLISKDNMKSE
ncbi:MAG: hypothetical protein LBV41_00525 [Cytophagaceae bacterium]|nr:hypothetical protein [Cytophagaceae bacterium]